MTGMNRATPAALPPQVYLTGIAAESYFGDRAWSLGEADEYTLLAAMDGASLIISHTDGGKHLLDRGHCLLLSPGAETELKVVSETELKVYLLKFHIPSGGQGLQLLAAGGQPFPSEPVHRLEIRLAELLALQGKQSDASLRSPLPGAISDSKESSAEDALLSLHRHVRFQELIYDVLSARNAAKAVKDPRLAIERTIAYLEKHYGEDIEIGGLAEREGLSRWRFERHFKALTGRSPLDYLTALRMNKAKELLSRQEQRVGEVAALVGYRDEYYFSRKFKQAFGMPPSRYAHGGCGTDQRIFSIQYLGELLALGVLPVGSNNALLRTIPEAPRSIRGVEDLPQINLHQLSGLSPNLILFPSYLDRLTADQLSGIADAVKVDWESDVYTRLRAMGRLLKREEEAERWIERYEKKAIRTRDRLEHCVREGETAAAFIYHEDGLFVYAGHHFGHSLYQGIGFEPTAGVRSLMDRDPNTKWKRIEPVDLPYYAGDRVFFALAHSGRMAEAGHRMLQHPAWQELPAVQEGKSYVVSDDWANYNPITLDKHLDHLARCLQVRRRA
jgi:ABC-type Fe3+-hydroxamate transport system substrate-binding protein